MKNVAVFKAPALKPLPGELTPSAIREAVLPVKIVAMSQAIAKCTELPELLNYKKTVDGLAAAARTIKHEIPEQVAMLNRTAKEAVFRMGELLLTYNGTGKTYIVKNTGKHARNVGHVPRVEESERSKVARSVGISRSTITAAARLAAAPADVRASILRNDKISAGAQQMSRSVSPRTSRGTQHRTSDKLGLILHGREHFAAIRGRGLTDVLAVLRGVPLDAFADLTPEERKAVKAKIVECQELLDEMDRRLGT